MPLVPSAYGAWKIARLAQNLSTDLDDFFRESDICPSCWGKKQVLNQQGQSVECSRCQGTGHYPPDELQFNIEAV